MSQKIYEKITNQIIEDIEQGNLPWELPWINGMTSPRNGESRHEYSGVNVLMLAMRSRAKGFESNQWLTYKQAEKLEMQVRRHEKGTPVVYYKTLQLERERNGETKEAKIPMLKQFTLFNLCQIQGAEKLIEKEHETIEALSEPERIKKAEAILKDSKAVINFKKQSGAFYRSSTDEITLPDRKQFKDTHALYSTAFHELTHWTGHKTRLNRPLGNPFGSPAYAREELIAEIGAAFLCASVGLEYSTQHASYVQSWLKALKGDSKLIFQASSKARQAKEFILGA